MQNNPPLNAVAPPRSFNTRGIPAIRRKRIVATVEAGGIDLRDSYEAWITKHPFGAGVQVLITGPLGFERTVQFGADEEPHEITERIRATLEE
jgi:hypothetical protein